MHLNFTAISKLFTPQYMKCDHVSDSRRLHNFHLKMQFNYSAKRAKQANTKLDYSCSFTHQKKPRLTADQKERLTYCTHKIQTASMQSIRYKYDFFSCFFIFLLLFHITHALYLSRLVFFVHLCLVQMSLLSIM